MVIGYRLLAARTDYSLTQGAVSFHKQPLTRGTQLLRNTLCKSLICRNEAFTGFDVYEHVSEFFRVFHKGFHRAFVVLFLEVLLALVHILVAILDSAIDDPREFVGRSGDGLRSVEARGKTAVVCAEIALAVP